MQRVLLLSAALEFVSLRGVSCSPQTESGGTCARISDAKMTIAGKHTIVTEYGEICRFAGDRTHARRVSAVEDIAKKRVTHNIKRQRKRLCHVLAAVFVPNTIHQLDQQQALQEKVFLEKMAASAVKACCRSRK